ncbi:uncharacterized protein LOC143911581 [Arctopsyche grandis]|uniref:uncharacterized protein LOC143911581 n=1 Tax=Arctopsyche grandis TaxID=121162 RepID=UPI00406D9B2A
MARPWLRAAIIAACALQVSASGLFELRLKSFKNELGRGRSGGCCVGGPRTSSAPASSSPCAAPCRTRFRVCLKHYQTNVDTTSPCTFGDVTTPVLGENNLNMTDSPVEGFINPIRFPFDFNWPGTFSLIVEAWHDSNETSRTGGGASGTLISRMSKQSWLGVSEQWQANEDRSSDGMRVLEYEYRVTCDAHYYGQGCANFCRPRDDRFGHFKCSPTGERICLSGWQDDYCDKPQCLPGCDTEHGSCNKPDECICHPGWVGRLCGECERYPGCMHGTCQKKWECLCNEGWGGLFCNQDLNFCTNHRPCQNNGTCFNTGQGSYTCSCPAGFTSTNCEQRVDGCSEHPCLNGGTCKEAGTSYNCSCPEGWHGPHCETAARTCADSPCRHGGTCRERPGGYVCACPPGLTGSDCERDVDDCASAPCLHGGVCTKTSGGGHKCSCPAGYIGDNCETDEDDCRGNPCLNGGTCVDLVGRFRCQCVPGYIDQLCQTKVNLCRTLPCANGGTCTDLDNDYRCACWAGFTGKDCSVDIDECHSSPCSNGGTCINRVNNFTCSCPNGWSGRRCESSTDGVVLGDSAGAGSLSRRIAHGAGSDGSDGGLSTQHLAAIVALGVGIPLLLAFAGGVAACLQLRRKRRRAEADKEARLQNERNAHASLAKRDPHVIKNTWGKCVNNVTASNSHVSELSECQNAHNISVAESECSGKGGGGGGLSRARSHKQLNTESAARLLSARLSLLSADSLCTASDASLVKRPAYSGDKTPSVYVIGDHLRPDPETFATQV